VTSQQGSERETFVLSFAPLTLLGLLLPYVGLISHARSNKEEQRKKAHNVYRIMQFANDLLQLALVGWVQSNSEEGTRCTIPKGIFLFNYVTGAVDIIIFKGVDYMLEKLM
jgi:hypothetical protein